MGGFVLHDPDDKPLHILDEAELNRLYAERRVEWPEISEREIQDRSKADAFSKAIAVMQTTWFIIQCISRGATHLAITELEIVTVAFAALNGITYLLWWDKPVDVRVPVAVYLIMTPETGSAVQGGSLTGPNVANVDNIYTEDDMPVDPEAPTSPPQGQRADAHRPRSSDRVEICVEGAEGTGAIAATTPRRLRKKHLRRPIARGQNPHEHTSTIPDLHPVSEQPSDSNFAAPGMYDDDVTIPSLLSPAPTDHQVAASAPGEGMDYLLPPVERHDAGGSVPSSVVVPILGIDTDAAVLEENSSPNGPNANRTYEEDDPSVNSENYAPLPQAQQSDLTEHFAPTEQGTSAPEIEAIQIQLVDRVPPNPASYNSNTTDLPVLPVPRQEDWPNPLSTKRKGHSVAVGLLYALVWLPVRPFFRPLWDMLNQDDIIKSNDPTSVPTFYSPVKLGNIPDAFLPMAGAVVIFGGIHFTPWSFSFPTLVEKWLWRVSAICITGLPLLFISVTYAFHRSTKSSDHISASLSFKILYLFFVVASGTAYLVSRVSLLLLPLALLRDLPSSIFVEVKWTNILPHT